jgi:hypothetical protein
MTGQGVEMCPVCTGVDRCLREEPSTASAFLIFLSSPLTAKGKPVVWPVFRGIVNRELKSHYLSRERLQEPHTHTQIGCFSDTKTSLKLQVT